MNIIINLESFVVHTERNIFKAHGQKVVGNQKMSVLFLF